MPNIPVRHAPRPATAHSVALNTATENAIKGKEKTNVTALKIALIHHPSAATASAKPARPQPAVPKTAASHARNLARRKATPTVLATATRLRPARRNARKDIRVSAKLKTAMSPPEQQAPEKLVAAPTRIQSAATENARPMKPRPIVPRIAETSAKWQAPTPILLFAGKPATRMKRRSIPVAM